VGALSTRLERFDMTVPIVFTVADVLLSRQRSALARLLAPPNASSAPFLIAHHDGLQPAQHETV
jgi:hypothetical protein